MLEFLCNLTILASLCTPNTLGALSPYQVVQGGTGSTTLSGILKGNGTSAIGTVVIGSNLSFDGTTLSATGGSSSGLSTSSPVSAGNLLTYSSAGAGSAYGTATTTLTAASPLSLDNPVLKVGGTNAILSIDTSGAWSGTAGSLAANGANCLSGSAPLGVDASGAVESCFDVWTEAENTSAAYLSTVDISANTNLAVTYPVVLTNDTLSIAFGTTTSNTWAGTQTFTNSPVFTALTGGLVYSNATTDTLANVSTTTLAVSGPFTVSGTLGNLVGGSNSTITWNGLATTSALSQGQLLYNTTGGNGVASVATSSASCSGFISCSGFTVVGSVSPTITTTGQLSIASGGTNASSFAPNALLYFNGTSVAATSSQPLYLGSIVSTTTATSTFAGGISTTRLSASATSTLAGLVVQTGGLKVPTLASCDTVDTNAAGDFICGTDASGGGGAFPFTPTTYDGVAVNATTTGLWLQATSPFSLIASSTFFTNASTTRLSISDNLIKQHSAGFLDIQRNGADFTLARILAPTASPYEATLATVVDCDVPAAGTNERFNDFYAENYSDSRQNGIRFAYSGSCPPVPWIMGFWPTAGQKDAGNQFMLMPNGTSAFAQATSTIDTAARLYIASSTASALLIVDSTPGTELLRITSDGKLGVGTSSPSDQITTVVGNNAGIRVSSSNSGFYDVGQGNGDRWRIQNNFTGTGLLEFLYNTGTGAAPATNLLTLGGTGSTVAGRVGIGSTTPWGRLGITGVTGSTNPIFNVASSSNASYFTIYPTGTTTIAGPSAATSTQYMYSTAASKGAVIILEDIDGAGCTEITALNGTLTAKTVTCPTEI